ncbi:MAG: hypothetical protein JWP34_2270 [Massilia sp.]|nr:hypothetical protein [Massilia sp.]
MWRIFTLKYPTMRTDVGRIEGADKLSVSYPLECIEQFNQLFVHDLTSLIQNSLIHFDPVMIGVAAGCE